MKTTNNPIQVLISSTISRIGGVPQTIHYVDLSVTYLNGASAGRINFDDPSELYELCQAVDHVVKTDTPYKSLAVQIWRESLKPNGPEFYNIDAGDSFLSIDNLQDMEVLRDTLNDFLCIPKAK